MISIIGYLAAILTTVSFVPQAIQTIKTKNTKGISLNMYLMFSIGVLCWLVYGLVNNDIPMIIANSITFVFSLIILAYKIKFR